MDDGDFWQTVTDKHGAAGSLNRIGSLKVAVLFAAAAIVSTVILTPILTVNSSSRIAFAPDSYDSITTGSISSSGGRHIYTVRRSVLQPMPDSICIIQRDGRTSGDC